MISACPGRNELYPKNFFSKSKSSSSVWEWSRCICMSVLSVTFRGVKVKRISLCFSFGRESLCLFFFPLGKNAGGGGDRFFYFFLKKSGDDGGVYNCLAGSFGSMSVSFISPVGKVAGALFHRKTACPPIILLIFAAVKAKMGCPSAKTTGLFLPFGLCYLCLWKSEERLPFGQKTGLSFCSACTVFASVQAKIGCAWAKTNKFVFALGLHCLCFRTSEDRLRLGKNK